MTSPLHIEPGGGNDTGPCGCCGRFSSKVWGYAWDDGEPFASYFVYWTMGHVPGQGANFDLVIGDWGKDAMAEDRVAVSLEYRLLETGPGFMVIDASARDIVESGLAGAALDREDVIGDSFAEEVFALCDAILAQDHRLAEILGGRTVVTG